MIAVSQRVDAGPHDERRDALDQRWTAFLAACGFGICPLPNRVEAARALVERVRPHGILLSGGNDLVSCGGDTPERDQVERDLLRWAMEKKLPVLGVCRGMQIIQHTWGVVLEPVDGHVTARQRIVRDGDLAWVNSYHRYAARDSCPELEILAHAEDGVVKAVRHREHRVLGIMWHPERMDPFEDRDVALVKSLFSGAPS